MNTKNIQEIYSEVLTNKDNYFATANQFLESNYWAIELDTPLVPLYSFCKTMLPRNAALNTDNPFIKYVDGTLKFKDSLNYIVDYILIDKIESYGEKPSMDCINSAYTALIEYWQNELQKDLEEFELATWETVFSLEDTRLNLLIDAFSSLLCL